MYTQQLKESTRTRTSTGHANETLASVMPPPQQPTMQQQQRRHSTDNPHSQGVDPTQLTQRLLTAVTFTESPENSPHPTIDNDSNSSIRVHNNGLPGRRFIYSRGPLQWASTRHFNSEQNQPETNATATGSMGPQLRTRQNPEMQQRQVATRPSVVVQSQSALKSQLVFVDADAGQGSSIQVSRHPAVGELRQSSAARVAATAVPVGSVRGGSGLPPGRFTTSSLSSQRQVTGGAPSIPAVSAHATAPQPAPVSAPLTSAPPMEFAAGSSSSEAPATTTKPQMVEIKRRDRNSAPPHRRRSQGSSRRTKSSSSERSKQSLAEQQAPAAVQPEPHIVAAQTLPATQGTGIHAPKTSSLGAVPQSAADETRALAQPRSRRANTLEPARSRMPKSDEVKKHNQEWTKDGKPVIRRHQAVELLMRTSGENLGDEEIVPRDDNERHNFESYLTDAGYDLAGVSITESDIGSFVLSELDDAPDRDAHNYVIRKDGKEVSIKDPSEGSKVGMAEAAKEAVALAAANAEARSASPAAQESAEVVSFSDLLNNDVFGSWTSSGQPTQANTAAPSTVHSSRHLMMVPVEADASGFLLEPLQELSESTASIHTSNIAAQQASQGSQPDTSDKPSVPEVVTGKGSDEADFRMNLLRRRSNGLNVSAARTGTMPQYQFPTQPDPVVVDGQPDSNTITVQYAITEPPLQTADQSSLPEGMPSFYRPGHNDKAGDCCEVPPDCSALFPKLSTTPSFFSAGRRNSMTEPTRPEPWASPGALPKTTSGLRRRRATVTGNTSGLVTKLATKETLGQSTALETASGLDHDTKVSGAPPGGSKAELKHRSQRASTAHSRSPTLPTATVETHKAGVKRTPPLVPPLPPQSRQRMAPASQPVDISEMQVLDLDPDSDVGSSKGLEFACCNCFSCRFSPWSSSNSHSRKRRHMSGRPRMVPAQTTGAGQRAGTGVGDSVGRSSMIDSSWRHVYRSNRPSSMATSRRSGAIRAALASPFHLCYNCLLWWLAPCMCASNSNNGCC